MLPTQFARFLGHINASERCETLFTEILKFSFLQVVCVWSKKLMDSGTSVPKVVHFMQVAATQRNWRNVFY